MTLDHPPQHSHLILPVSSPVKLIVDSVRVDSCLEHLPRESCVERLFLSMAAPLLNKTAADASVLNVAILEKHGVPLDRVAAVVADHAALAKANATFKLLREKTGSVWTGLITGDGFHKVALVCKHGSLTVLPNTEMHVCSHKQLAYLHWYCYIRGTVNHLARTRMFLNRWMSGSGFWSKVPKRMQDQRWGLTPAACWDVLKATQQTRPGHPRQHLLPDAAWDLYVEEKNPILHQCWLELVTWSSLPECLPGCCFEVEMWRNYAAKVFAFHRRKWDGLQMGCGMLRWSTFIHTVERPFWDMAVLDWTKAFPNTYSLHVHEDHRRHTSICKDRNFPSGDQSCRGRVGQTLQRVLPGVETISVAVSTVVPNVGCKRIGSGSGVTSPLCCDRSRHILYDTVHRRPRDSKELLCSVRVGTACQRD